MKDRMNADQATAFTMAMPELYPVQKETICQIMGVDSSSAGGLYDDMSGEGFVAVPGGFAWPLPVGTGRLSRGFIPGEHGGFDWAEGEGTPIYAVADGIVQVSEYHHSWGNHVRILHTGADGRQVQTNYAHMVQFPNVVTGQEVHQGDTIGYVGNTGRSFGNHLHFEVWEGSSPSNRVDPQPYFPGMVLHNQNG